MEQCPNRWCHSWWYVVDGFGRTDLIGVGMLTSLVFDFPLCLVLVSQNVGTSLTILFPISRCVDQRDEAVVVVVGGGVVAMATIQRRC